MEEKTRRKNDPIWIFASFVDVHQPENSEFGNVSRSLVEGEENLRTMNLKCFVRNREPLAIFRIWTSVDPLKVVEEGDP